MSSLRINGFAFAETFKRDYKKAPPEVKSALPAVLEGLKQNPQPKKLRVHSLNGCFDPRIFKADVTPNHAWQLTFHLDGEIAVLRRLGTHKQVDRDG